MVFVSAVEAKPMVPHKDGRSCLGCEATLASQWRGPGSNYCSLSQCKKAAGAAREQMRNTADAPLEETVAALQTEVHELEEQIGTLDRRVEEQQKRLTEQDKAFAAMQRQWPTSALRSRRCSSVTPVKAAGCKACRQASGQPFRPCRHA